MLDPCGNSVFSLLRNLLTVLHGGCTNFHSHPRGRRAPSLRPLTSTHSRGCALTHSQVLFSLVPRRGLCPRVSAQCMCKPHTIQFPAWARGPAFLSSLTAPGALALGAVGGWMAGGLSLHSSHPEPAGDSRPWVLLHCPHCSEAAGPLTLTVQQGPWDSPSTKKRTQQEQEEAVPSTEENDPECSRSHAITSQPRAGPETQSGLWITLKLSSITG